MEEIRTDGRPMTLNPEIARKLARAGIANKPERARRDLIELINALNLKEPSGIEMILQLIDAAGENIEKAQFEGLRLRNS